MKKYPMPQPATTARNNHTLYVMATSIRKYPTINWTTYRRVSLRWGMASILLKKIHNFHNYILTWIYSNPKSMLKSAGIDKFISVITCKSHPHEYKAFSTPPCLLFLLYIYMYWRITQQRISFSSKDLSTCKTIPGSSGGIKYRLKTTGHKCRLEYWSPCYGKLTTCMH